MSVKRTRVTSADFDTFYIVGESAIAESASAPNCIEIPATIDVSTASNKVLRITKSKAMHACLAMLTVAGYRNIRISADADRDLSVGEAALAETDRIADIRYREYDFARLVDRNRKAIQALDSVRDAHIAAEKEVALTAADCRDAADAIAALKAEK